MLKLRSRALTAFGLVAVFVSPALGAIPTVATFDVDAEGFVGSTTSTTQIFAAAGGNTGGHIQIRKDLSPPEFDVGSRTSTDTDFLGDYAAGGITGAGFDMNAFNTTLNAVWLRFRSSVTLNGWHYDFGVVTPDANTWISYDVAFNPLWDDVTAAANGWTQEAGAGSFASTLATVDWIEIRAINEESLIAGLDNIRLVPTPGAGLLAGLAALGVARRRRSA